MYIFDSCALIALLAGESGGGGGSDKVRYMYCGRTIDYSAKLGYNIRNEYTK
jgi:hypothetical protein